MPKPYFQSSMCAFYNNDDVEQSRMKKKERQREKERTFPSYTIDIGHLN